MTNMIYGATQHLYNFYNWERKVIQETRLITKGIEATLTAFNPFGENKAVS